MLINTDKYNLDWFKNRAKNSIKKINENVWDFSDSLLLYTPSGSEAYETLQESDSLYSVLVTKPEHEYLKKVAHEIVSVLPDDFEYIDLGPGTEHKEVFIFEEAKKQGKNFLYIPVDISDYFLDQAEKFALSQEINTQKVKASFEELPDVLGKSKKPRFVSLGLTFSNYMPQDVISLLEKIASNNGFIFINSQIRDRVDMKSLLEVYQSDARNLAYEKIRLLGINPEKDTEPSVADDGFRIWTKVLNTNSILANLGIKVGDTILVFQSLRYTKEGLQKELLNTNHTIFDTGDSFIGALIKT